MVLFNESEINIILNNFPTINMKCCYETIAKFHTNETMDPDTDIDSVTDNDSKYDFYTAIPFGKKYIIWFTIYNNKKSCFLLLFDAKKKVKFIKKIFVPFTNELICSVFYGTNFYIKEKQESFITLEDVLYYREKDTTNSTELEKLNIFQMIFTNKNFSLPGSSNNHGNMNNTNVIGLPLMNKDKTSLMTELELLPYKIDMIICKNFNNNTKKYLKMDKKCNIDNNTILSNTQSHPQPQLQSPINKVNIFDIINKVPTKKVPMEMNDDNISLKPSNKCVNRKTAPQPKHLNTDRMFIVKPDIQNDIYHLYTSNNNKEEYYDTAYIPTYTTSVMMNKLFRNIKENENLDTLEESDDEEEFENNNIDKFVYLEKSYAMICKYNYKFKKWFPVSLVKNDM